MAAGYSHIVAPATTFGKNFLPRVAALLDVAQISDIVAVEAPDTFVRPIYAGNVLATVKSSDAVKVISVRTTGFDAAGDGGSASVAAIAVPPLGATTDLVGRELTVSARPELAAAKIIVSGGRGLGNSENYHKVLEPLADKLGAAMGASRAAVFVAAIDLAPAIASSSSCFALAAPDTPMPPTICPSTRNGTPPWSGVNSPSGSATMAVRPPAMMSSKALVSFLNSAAVRALPTEMVAPAAKVPSSRSSAIRLPPSSTTAITPPGALSRRACLIFLNGVYALVRC